MTDALKIETRFLALMAIIVLLYGVSVIGVAALHDQLASLEMRSAGFMMSMTIMVGVGAVFIAYSLDLMIRRRPEYLFRTMISELRANLCRLEWALGRFSVIMTWYGLLFFFVPFKAIIGHVRGFPYDAMLVQADKALFLGVDPWRVTHALFGDPYITFGFQAAYNAWFMMMGLSIIYMLLRPEWVRLRAQYLLSFTLCWILVGSLGAWWLASAGPCFYQRAFGDAYYQDLMQQLSAMDHVLRANGLGLFVLDLQDTLWAAQTANGHLFGGGISAMPSMHVSVATLLALGGMQISRRAGLCLGAFAVVIWVGSIHLGWHYAWDGIVAFVATLGIWKLSAWMLARFVYQTQADESAGAIPAAA